MGYPIVTAQNAIQEHPIASCGDYCYVVFGGAYRDFVDDAHRVMTNVIQPVFDQIAGGDLRDDISVLEAMKERFTRLDLECHKAEELIGKMNDVENLMQFRWENWSDLINPLFWLQALAYGSQFVSTTKQTEF